MLDSHKTLNVPAIGLVHGDTAVLDNGTRWSRITALRFDVSGKVGVAFGCGPMEWLESDERVRILA